MEHNIIVHSICRACGTVNGIFKLNEIYNTSRCGNCGAIGKIHSIQDLLDLANYYLDSGHIDHYNTPDQDPWLEEALEIIKQQEEDDDNEKAKQYE